MGDPNEKPDIGVDFSVFGLCVKFPFTPYPSQRAVMSRVINGLKKKQNCLIESPTGSGKSLALLCSCLAWQKQEKAIYYEKLKKIIEEREAKQKECAHCCGAPRCAHKTASNVPSRNGNVKTHSCVETSPALSTQYQWAETALAVADNTAEATGVGEDSKPICQGASCSKSETRGETKASSIPIEDTDSDDDFQPVKRQRRLPSKGTRKNTTKAEQTTTVIKGPGSECPSSPAVRAAKVGSCEKVEKQEERLEKVPLIYYGTRTHKQIAQVVRELRKSAYGSLRMAVLSSRERTCIHPHISRTNNKNEECKELLENNGCPFQSHLKKFTEYPTLYEKGSVEPYDLEDLVNIGKKLKVCPYFWTLDLIPSCDIVFCPYNYLIDPIIRKCLDIKLDNAIVVLDEAHNIEDSSREAMSLSITQDQIRDIVNDLEELQRQGVSPEDHHAVAKVMSRLSIWITQHSDHLNDYRSFDQSGKVWAGREILALLTEVGLGQQTFPILKKIITAITTVEKDPEKYVPVLLASTCNVLQNIVLILDYLYKDSMKYMEDFRAAVVKTVSNKKITESHGDWISKSFAREKSWTHTLSFWCLNPAVAMSDIKEKTHSVIVASGTLWPMDSFESELDTPFPLKLQTGHVVQSDAVWVGSLSNGPTNHQLTATFKNTEVFAFQDEVGRVVLDVCKIVPNGVLCFFPSYSMMNKLTQRWQTTGLWNELCECKFVVTEPQKTDASSFDASMAEYYKYACNEAGDCPKKGAILLAVCRGKVSEGLDFADDSARAVITVGIPFPNIKDIQVDQKKKYNDSCIKMGRPVMSGNTWYETQGFRALNQALGRCIRHKSDWGALVVVDHRFTEREKYRKGLSKWIREKVCCFRSYSDAMSSLQRFVDLKMESRNEAEYAEELSMIVDGSPLDLPSKIESPEFADRSRRVDRGQCGLSSSVGNTALVSSCMHSVSTDVDMDGSSLNTIIEIPASVDIKAGTLCTAPGREGDEDTDVSVIAESPCSSEAPSSPELF